MNFDFLRDFAVYSLGVIHINMVIGVTASIGRNRIHIVIKEKNDETFKYI
jgi:hypothetical protein